MMSTPTQLQPASTSHSGLFATNDDDLEMSVWFTEDAAASSFATDAADLSKIAPGTRNIDTPTAGPARKRKRPVVTSGGRADSMHGDATDDTGEPRVKLEPVDDRTYEYTNTSAASTEGRVGAMLFLAHTSPPHEIPQSSRPHAVNTRRERTKAPTKPRTRAPTQLHPSAANRGAERSVRVKLEGEIDQCVDSDDGDGSGGALRTATSNRALASAGTAASKGPAPPSECFDWSRPVVCGSTGGAHTQYQISGTDADRKIIVPQLSDTRVTYTQHDRRPVQPPYMPDPLLPYFPNFQCDCQQCQDFEVHRARRNARKKSALAAATDLWVPGAPPPPVDLYCACNYMSTRLTLALHPTAPGNPDPGTMKWKFICEQCRELVEPVPLPW